MKRVNDVLCVFLL